MDNDSSTKIVILVSEEIDEIAGGCDCLCTMSGGRVQHLGDYSSLHTCHSACQKLPGYGGESRCH